MLDGPQAIRASKPWEQKRGIKRSAPTKSDPESSKKKAKGVQSSKLRSQRDARQAFEKRAASKRNADDEDDSDNGQVSEPNWEASDNEEQPTAQDRKANGPSSKHSTTTRPSQSGLANATTTNNSREAHQKQKAVAKERRDAKPNADVLASAKQVWEVLRAPNLPKDKQRKHAIELLEQVSGRAKDFVFKHDGARIFQAAWRYSKSEEKRGLAREMKGHYRNMAESQYAKHVLDKMLSFKDSEIRTLAMDDFYGHVRHMIRHPHAGWALDDAYRGAANKQQKARLLREWYGAEYAIFKDDDGKEAVSDLKLILTEHPEKRQPIMRYLFEIVNLLIQKQTWRFEMLHDAMLQYYANLTPLSEEWERFFELLMEDDQPGTKSNLALVLSESRSGSRLLALAFAHSSAKHRKLLLRKFKDNITVLASHEHAHLVLIAALEATDDTVLSGKTIYGELVSDWKASSNISALAGLQQRWQRSVLLLPFVHKESLTLSPPQVQFLSELHEIRRTASKKDPVTRRLELAQYLAPHMLDTITALAPDLLANKFTCVAVQEVLLNCPAKQDETTKATLDAALDALVALLFPEDGGKQTPGEQTNDDEELQPEDLRAVADSPAAVRVFKNLVLAGYYNAAGDTVELCSTPPHFAARLAAKFASPAGEDELVAWATGVRAFLIEALLRTTDLADGEKDGLRKVLLKRREDIKKCADEVVPEDKGDDVDKTNGTEERGKTRRVAIKGAQAVLAALDKTPA